MKRILKRGAKKVIWSRVSALILIAFAMTGTPASAQLPTPLPQPNVNLLTSGKVYAIARLPDGSAILGGDFVSVNGVPRSNIAKRLPDGTLDLTWHPVIDGTVLALAADAQGNVYASGYFNHADEYSRRHLVKLTSKGAVAPDWNPSPDADVQALLVTPAGEAFVGGYFQNIGGHQRKGLAKLSASTGMVDSQWNPASAQANISAMQLSHDGQLYVGGRFYGMGSFPGRRHLAKVSTSGTGLVDAKWDPSPNSTVTSIAVTPDGDVFVAGEFYQFGEFPNVKLARWSAAKLAGIGSGDPIAEWDPFDSAQHIVATRVALSSDGWVYMSGGPTYVYPDPNPLPRAIQRASISGTGAIDAGWTPLVNSDVYAISVGLDDVFAGGYFNDVAGQTRLGFVALDGNGAAGAALDAENPTDSVLAMASQPDGKLIVSGFFEKADGQLRKGLLRLNGQGSLDPNWNPSTNGFVRAIAIAADGSVFVGGTFSQIGGEERRGIAKLDSTTGAADADWNPQFNFGRVDALAVDDAGYVYVGGDFSMTGSTARNLIRIPALGSGILDPSWLPAPERRVRTLSLDGHGSLFVGGAFSTMAGQSRRGTAKLLTTGPILLDPMWNPPQGIAYQIVADGLGSVFVAGGGFVLPDGGLTMSISKLSASGVGAADPLWKPITEGTTARIAIDVEHSSLYAVSSTYDGTTGIDTYYLSKHSTNGIGETDAAWNPIVVRGFDQGVGVIQTDSERVLIGGKFTHVSGQQRYGLAALPLSVPDMIHADGFDATP